MATSTSTCRSSVGCSRTRAIRKRANRKRGRAAFSVMSTPVYPKTGSARKSAVPSTAYQPPARRRAQNQNGTAAAVIITTLIDFAAW